MFCAKSAVYSFNPVTVAGIIRFFRSSGNLSQHISWIARTMDEWKEQKEKFLAMTTEEKRKYYRCSIHYKTPDAINTWVEYFNSKSTLPPAVQIMKNFELECDNNDDIINKISMYQGDITTLELDVIVNAANKSLLGGSGVDGAIHNAAGRTLKIECRTLKGCKTGEAKITGGYELPARYVIHTVGPQDVNPDQLGLCYKNSLNIMLQNQLRTIAFPCISTGVYSYPIDRAAHIACQQVRRFLEKNHEEVDRIIFCLFGAEDVCVYEKSLQTYFPIIKK